MTPTDLFLGLLLALCLLGLLAAYPGILVISLLLKRSTADWKIADDYRPSVTIFLAAYNEERIITDKLNNCLELDYPSDKLQVVVVSDQSTDRTPDLIDAYSDPRVRRMDYGLRLGKASIMNRTLCQLSSDIVVITDANVMFERDTLLKLVRWYADPRIGLVSGYEQRIQREREQFQAETWYRDFDVLLKSAEGGKGAAMGAYGGIYSLRTACWRPLPDETQNEDLTTTLNVLRQGQATIHDREARAEEAIGSNPDLEFGRRVRIGAGNYQCFWWNLWLLNPLQGWKSLFYWIHKVPRWFTPHLLLGALSAHVALALRGHFAIWLIPHLAIYAIGLIGLVQNRRGQGRGWVSTLGHFLHMNAAVGVGFIKWLGGIRVGTWTPARP